MRFTDSPTRASQKILTLTQPIEDDGDNSCLSNLVIPGLHGMLSSIPQQDPALTKNRDRYGFLTSGEVHQRGIDMESPVSHVVLCLCCAACPMFEIIVHCSTARNT
jgi:hypothetical protein